MKKQIAFKRKDNELNILVKAFNTGKTQHLINVYENRILTGDYLIVDSKLQTQTRNVMIVPLKLDRNVVGCIEIANKKGGN